jgi:hypothetical protein
MDRLTKEKLRGPPFIASLPHVVVLGAGASRAAFPSGDRNRKMLPLIDDLPNVLGKPWNELVKFSQPPVEGFEAQFSWMRRQGGFADGLNLIERLIREYFEDLELPDTATIYDYLVLGLCPKDTIATFNWDPLLLFAHKRNRDVAKLPDVRFLHGCVGYFTCSDHDVLGLAYESCPECHNALTPGELFFPDDQKDYTRDTIIHRDWKAVTAKLTKAFHLTIFGYSGPVTDYNARQLLLKGWAQTGMREVSHVEIIDIKDDDALRHAWRDFIPFHHDMLVRDFWHSTIAKFPRRTAEYKLCASLYGIPAEPFGPLRTDSLHELQDWHAAIAVSETVNRSQNPVATGD